MLWYHLLGVADLGQILYYWTERKVLHRENYQAEEKDW